MEYEEIKKLMEDMGESKIDSLEIEFPEGTKISMKKNASIVLSEREEQIVKKEPKLVKEVVSKEENRAPKEENAEEYKTITSPMVGTFYRSSSPNEEPFVKVGDHVSKGDVLCVIEAMKLMNEIESEEDGIIVEICAENDEAVDYGKVLFKIK